MENLDKITTIKLTQTTKNRLEKLKIHEKESFESVVNQMLYLLNTCKVNPQLAREKMHELDNLRLKLLENNKKKNR